MRIAKNAEVPPPRSLGKTAAALWKSLNTRFVFEDVDLQRLLVACKQIDIIEDCENAIARDGRFQPTKGGTMRAHPAVVAARDATVLKLRALRELGVDVELPSESRIPRQERRYG